MKLKRKNLPAYFAVWRFILFFSRDSEDAVAFGGLENSDKTGVCEYCEGTLESARLDDAG